MDLVLVLSGLLRFVCCLTEALSGCLLRPLRPDECEITLLEQSLGSKMAPTRVCTHKILKTQKR